MIDRIKEEIFKKYNMPIDKQQVYIPEDILDIVGVDNIFSPIHDSFISFLYGYYYDKPYISSCYTQPNVIDLVYNLEIALLTFFDTHHRYLENCYLKNFKDKVYICLETGS